MKNIIEDIQSIVDQHYPSKSDNKKASISLLTLFSVYQLPYFKNRYDLYKIKSNEDETLFTLGFNDLNNINCVQNGNVNARNLDADNYLFYNKYDLSETNFDSIHMNGDDISLLKKVQDVIIKSNSFQDLESAVENLSSQYDDFFCHLKYIQPKLKDAGYDKYNSNSDLISIIVSYFSKDEDLQSKKYKTKVCPGNIISFGGYNDMCGHDISLLSEPSQSIKNDYINGETEKFNALAYPTGTSFNKDLTKAHRKKVIKLIAENKHPFLKKSVLASCLNNENSRDRILDIMNNKIWNKAKTESLLFLEDALSLPSQEQIMDKFKDIVDPVLAQLLNIKPQLNKTNNEVNIKVYKIPKNQRPTVDLAGTEYLESEDSWNLDKGLKGFNYMQNEYFMTKDEYRDQVYFIAHNDLEILGFADIRQCGVVSELRSLDFMDAEINNRDLHHEILNKVYDYVESNNYVLRYSYGSSSVHEEYKVIVPDHIKSFEQQRKSDVLTVRGNYSHGDEFDDVVNEIVENNQDILLNSTLLQKRKLKDGIEKIKENYGDLYLKDLHFAKKWELRDKAKIDIDKCLHANLKNKNIKKVGI
jgi:hypothetical protein